MGPKREMNKRKAADLEDNTTQKRRRKETTLKPENDVSCNVVIMGDGDTGQLGLGPDVTVKSRPAVIPDLEDVLQVAVGGMHTVVLTKSNQVITFGCNDEGALGRDTSVEGSESSPGPVEISGNVVQVSAGDSHSAALTDDGLLYAWGTFRDAHGSMGLFDNQIEKVPVHVKFDVKFKKVASGSHHIAVLGADGKVYSAGCGEQGQLGRLSEQAANRNGRHGLSRLLTLSLVNNKIKAANVWTGAYNTFVQSLKGDIFVFGLNNHSQLGIENPSEDKNVYYHPIVSKGFSGKKWVKISGSDHHTLALDDKGSVYALGRKEYGRLGLGKDCSDALVPTEVKIGDDIKCSDISCGNSASFAITKDGKLYSWGMGSTMLGHGDTDDDVFVPTLVKGKQIENKTILYVSTGGQHSAALIKS